MAFPTSGLARLSKSLIQVRGIDATKFLNGLLTSRLLPNIIKKKQHTISEAESRHANLAEIIDTRSNYGLMHEDIYDPDFNIGIGRDGINSMILNSKGRVVTDLFLYTLPFDNYKDCWSELMQTPGYLIEVDQANSRSVLTMLKMHKLSAKVKFQEDQGLHSYYYYDDSQEFLEWMEDVQSEYFSSADPVNALQSANSFIRKEVIFNTKYAGNILGFAFDNRIPSFGFKFVTNRKVTEDVTSEKEKEEKDILIHELFSSNFKFPVAKVAESAVEERRFVNGLFETHDARDDAKLLPFECNLDYTNGLSLDKGCYVGQELTIRTYNNKTTRKRVFPVEFFRLTPEFVAEAKSYAGGESTQALPQVELIAPEDVPIESLEESEVWPLFEGEEQGEVMDKGKSGEETTRIQSNNPFASSMKSRSPRARVRRNGVGKTLARNGNLGFCTLPISSVEKFPFFKLKFTPQEGEKEVEIGVKAVIPDWWPE